MTVLSSEASSLTKKKAEAVATQTDRAVADLALDPILVATDERFCLFPIRDAELWEFYTTAKASFWTAQEIDLEQDKVDWSRLREEERKFIRTVLAFFAVADNIVNENIVTRFYDEVQLPEARQVYAMQMAIEAIHAETYGLLIEFLIADRAERETLHRALVPSVQVKAEWAKRYLEADLSFGERLVAFICVEGIFFSASFCSIFYMKKRGFMPGLTFSNELISRDEGQHVQFACALFRRLTTGRPADETVYEVFRAAVACEEQFVDDALSADLIGINAKQMKEYVKYVADFTLINYMSMKPLFGATNPFDWMALISTEGKTNFFERRVGEYQMANVKQGASHTLEELDDF